MGTQSGYVYKMRQDAELRLRSARHLVKVLLQAEKDLHQEHLDELLGIACWKLNEAETEKYQTQFCSKSVWESSNWFLARKSDRQAGLRHDHVYRSKQMIRDLSGCHPEQVDEIINKAVGCVVTVSEHTKLHEFDQFDGWERYVKAGISVVDARTGQIMAWK